MIRRRKGLRSCCGHLSSLPLIRWSWWGKREVSNRWQKGVCPACLSLTGWLIYWRSRWWILDFWRRKSFVFNTENDTPDYIFKIKGKISKIVAIVSHMRSFLEPFFFKGSKGGKLFLFENTDLQAWICFGEGHRSMQGQGASRKRKIPQSTICQPLCVLCIYMKMLSFLFLRAWAMPHVLHLSCGIPFPVKTPGIISRLTSVKVWLSRWEVIKKNFK